MPLPPSRFHLFDRVPLLKPPVFLHTQLAGAAFHCLTCQGGFCCLQWVARLTRQELPCQCPNRIKQLSSSHRLLQFLQKWFEIAVSPSLSTSQWYNQVMINHSTGAFCSTSRNKYLARTKVTDWHTPGASGLDNLGKSISLHASNRKITTKKAVTLKMLLQQRVFRRCDVRATRSDLGVEELCQAGVGLSSCCCCALGLSHAAKRCHLCFVPPTADAKVTPSVSRWVCLQ